MKYLKHLITMLIIAVNFTAALAQNTKQEKAAILKKAIENKNYTFIAQYVQPLGGGQQYINYNYDLRVKPDSVVAFLPYFGTVQFAPPYNATDGGIKFTSTRFDYQTVVKRINTSLPLTPKMPVITANSF